MKTLFSINLAMPPKKRAFAVLFASLSLTALSVSAADMSTQKLFGKWSDPAPSSYELGSGQGTLAASEKWIIAGAPLADEGGTDRGAVQVFNAATGSWVRKLSHPDLSLSGTFMGQSCAISGDIALIGVPGPTSTSAGSVLVFNLANGRFLNSLIRSSSIFNGIPAAANGDRYGESIAIFGNFALIGSPGSDGSKGSAFIVNYLDKRILRQLTDPSGAANDKFGTSVAVHGNIGIVGSPKMDNKGGFVAFDLTTGEILKRFVPASAVANDTAGNTVSIVKNFILVSAVAPGESISERVIAYNWLTNTETILTASDWLSGDLFGSSLSAAQGGLVVIGAKGANGSEGAAYLFDLNSSSLNELMKIQLPGELAFGSASALVGDRAIIAASKSSTISATTNSPLTNMGALLMIKPITSDLPIQKITARGDFAPGAENIAFNAFGDVSLNADGETAFSSTLSGLGSNKNKDTGVWTTVDTPNLSLKTKSRFPLSGNINFNVIGKALLNAPDRVIYQSTLSSVGSGIAATSINNQLIVYGPNPALDRIRSGEKIVSFPTPSGSLPTEGALPLNFMQVVQSRNAASPLMSAACTLRVGHNGTVATNDSGLFTTNFTNTAPPDPILNIETQREGSTAISITVPTISTIPFGQFTGRVVQYDSLTVFATALAGVPKTSDQALFSRNFGGTTNLISRKGDPANDGTLLTPTPITGATYASYIAESADATNVLYRATIVGTPAASVPSAQNEGLWLHNGTTSRLILRKGADLGTFTTNYNPAPIILGDAPLGLAGIRIAKFISFWQTNGQQLALVQLAGTGVNSANDQALILVQNSPSKQLNVLLREGQVAPGCGNATIGVISRVEVEPNSGAYLALTTLAGAAKGTELALFQGSSSLPVSNTNLNEDMLRRPYLVLRKGQLYNNQPSKVKSFSLPTTNLTAGGAGATGLSKAIQEGTTPSVVTESAIVVEFDNGVRQIMKGKL